jgi:hypothetical protein
MSAYAQICKTHIVCAFGAHIKRLRNALEAAVGKAPPAEAEPALAE